MSTNKPPVSLSEIGVFSLFCTFIGSVCGVVFIPGESSILYYVALAILVIGVGLLNWSSWAKLSGLILNSIGITAAVMAVCVYPEEFLKADKIARIVLWCAAICLLWMWNFSRMKSTDPVKS